MAKVKCRVGQRIRYKHPNYPKQKREGRIVTKGDDGLQVLTDEGHIERVRHNHVLEVMAGKKVEKSDAPLWTLAPASISLAELLVKQQRRKQRELVKSGFGGTPFGKAKQTGLPGSGAGGQMSPHNLTNHTSLQWKPPVVSFPHNNGHVVTYQRPDMHEPGQGVILTHAQDGAILHLANGAKHKVRWEHIHGRAKAHVEPGERSEAAEALRKMGIPLDPAEGLLSADPRPKPNADALEQLKILVQDGVPVDLAAASKASDMSLQRLIQALVGEKEEQHDSTTRAAGRAAART